MRCGGPIPGKPKGGPINKKSESCKLTRKQLEGYRQWLSELDEEAQETGDFKSCDDEIYETFCLSSQIGLQVYESYTDEELLDIFLKTRTGAERKLQFGRIYCIYKIYIRKRFGSLERAKTQAIIRRKNLRDERRWPPDWPDRIDLEPFYRIAQAKHITILDSDREMLEGLVRSAQRMGLPPVVTAAQRKQLKKLGCGNEQNLFYQIGIPVLGKNTMKHMRQFWLRARGASSGSPEASSRDGVHKEEYVK